MCNLLYYNGPWMGQRFWCTVINPNKDLLSFCSSAPSLHLSCKCTSILLNSLIHHASPVFIWMQCHFPTPQPFPIPASCRCQCLLASGGKDKDLSKITNSSIAVYLCGVPFTRFPVFIQCIAGLFCHVFHNINSFCLWSDSQNCLLLKQ